MSNIQRKTRLTQDLEERFYEAEFHSNLRKIIGVFTIMVMPIFLYVGWLIAGAVVSKMEKTAQSNAFQLEHQAILNQKKEFNRALQYGEAYLFADNLRLAQINYTLALSLKPEDKFANIGMTKTLCRQCLEKNLFCKEAIDYLNYCRGMRYNTDDLEQLEWQLGLVE